MKKFLILLLTLIPTISYSEPDNFDFYHVELIVFLNKNVDYRSEEWPKVNLADSTKDYNITLKINGKETRPIKIKNDSDHPTELAEKRLIKEFKRINNNPNYQPILHLAWKSPINYGDIIDLFIKQDNPLNIAADDIDNPAFNFPYLQGSLHINRLRYIHVNANLDVNLPLILAQNSEKVISFEDLQKNYGKNFSDYIVKTFHINNDRKKIRSSELHYLDNPVVGILIKFNRETA